MATKKPRLYCHTTTTLRLGTNWKPHATHPKDPIFLEVSHSKLGFHTQTLALSFQDFEDFREFLVQIYKAIFVGHFELTFD